MRAMVLASAHAHTPEHMMAIACVCQSFYSHDATWGQTMMQSCGHVILVSQQLASSYSFFEPGLYFLLQVCLVSCMQPLSQYKLILNKLGTNLEQVITDSKFTFVSVLNLCTESDKICLCSDKDLTSNVSIGLRYTGNSW